MTQEELSAKLGISRTTVTMWETADTNPPSQMLPELAKILDCKLEDFYNTV